MRRLSLVLIIPVLIGIVSLGFAQMYKWVDEKGTVHYTDDPSRIPERYRLEAESREVREEKTPPKPPTQPAPPPSPVVSEPPGFEVDLIRRHELWLAEVVLNERVRRRFIIDTGASFTLINRQTATELGIVIDESTPVIPGATVSGTILTPLVTLKSVRVGKAMVENVEAMVHTMPAIQEGLLGNSFLNKFRVVLDSVNGKMTLFAMKGKPSADYPGGFGRDYWTGQFRFYHRVLAHLKTMKERYERQGGGSELNRVNMAIRFFENQLSELERRASLVGVPRHWRE